MSDYSLSLLNTLSHSDNTVKEYYIIPSVLSILFIIGFYIHSHHKRFNRIEKYLEEINAEYRDHYYFRCEEKLRSYFKESYDNLDTKFNRECDNRYEEINNKIEKSISEIHDTNAKLVNSIIVVADEANKAITFTNSRTEENINESIDRQIIIMNAGICEIQRNNNKEFQEIYETIAKLQDNLKMNTIEDNKYQTWIGTGEYVQDGNYKYTAQIKIVNKRLHTFAENKLWIDDASVDDASVAYKDSLMAQIKYYRANACDDNFINNMSSWVGFKNDKKNYPVVYSDINNDNNQIEMSCHKYEWQNTIYIQIFGRKIYDNREDAKRGVQYQNELLPHIMFNEMPYIWKKSLKSC